MSFASSANSALVPILPKYPSVNPNVVGYVEDVDLITDVVYPSGATLQNAFALTQSLADGVWVLSGVLLISTPGTFPNIATGEVLVNGIAVSSVMAVGVAAHTVVSVPISTVISSNQFFPNVELQVQAKCTSNSGADWSIQLGIGSNLKLTRVA
jgi:hypothetical protein